MEQVMNEFETLEPIAVDNIEPDVYDEPCEPDNWADGDALASAGYGVDEDYGFFGNDDY
jgi:hypothetical protein